MAAGNSWVLELRPGRHDPRPVWFVCHDAPVLVYQSPTSRPSSTITLRYCAAPHDGSGSRRRPGVRPCACRRRPTCTRAQLLDSEDPVLRDFARRLDDRLVRPRPAPAPSPATACRSAASARRRRSTAPGGARLRLRQPDAQWSRPGSMAADRTTDVSGCSATAESPIAAPPISTRRSTVISASLAHRYSERLNALTSRSGRSPMLKSK